MTMPVGCEDKDAIVAYLYEEVDPVERSRIEAHLATCGACRAEVNALRAVRNELPAWAPPERDLGFTIVDRAQSAAPPRRWVMPAWGLAAAATLVLAAAAAIANVEIRYGADGLSVRTGWSRGGDVAARTASAPAPVTAGAAGGVARRVDEPRAATARGVRGEGGRDAPRRGVNRGARAGRMCSVASGRSSARARPGSNARWHCGSPRFCVISTDSVKPISSVFNTGLARSSDRPPPIGKW